MGRTKPVELGEGERYVPLAEAVELLGAPSAAALRARAYRAEADPHSSAAELGFERRGGRWFVLVRDPDRGKSGDGA